MKYILLLKLKLCPQSLSIRNAPVRNIKFFNYKKQWPIEFLIIRNK